MAPLLRISALIDALNERVGKTVYWLVLATVLISAGNAIMRKMFSMSSNAWLELQWYLFSAVFLLCSGYTLLRNEHVRIDAVAGRLSPRTQAWIEIVGSVLFLLPTVTIIAWYSWPSLVNSIHIDEYSSDPGGLIRWPVRLLIPVAFTLLGLQGISELIKRIAFLRGLVPATIFEKKGHGDVI